MYICQLLILYFIKFLLTDRGKNILLIIVSYMLILNKLLLKQVCYILNTKLILVIITILKEKLST